MNGPRSKLTHAAREYGLHARAMRPGRRWAVDWDYLHKLGPAERAWLERFGREFYGADARALKSPGALHATRELRASVYGAQNSAFRDVYSRGLVKLAWGDGDGA